jgi:homoserine kinase type II
MPGAADYRQHASNARLSAAMRALAEFHVAAASFPGTSTELRTPPSIVSRVGTLAAWQSGDVEQLRRTVSSSPESELTVLAQDIIDRFKPRMAELHDDLQGALPLRVRLQPCIRDIHDQHVLFEGDRVTGIVDFGAMKIDNVATDIQRLLGSMAGNDRESWHHGITAYEVTSPLAREELRLIETLDRSTLLLSGMNWLRWLFLDNRQFDDLSAAIVRLHTIRDRLAGV